jgi:hypothetical protein
MQSVESLLASSTPSPSSLGLNMCCTAPTVTLISWSKLATGGRSGAAKRHSGERGGRCTDARRLTACWRFFACCFGTIHC